MHARGLEVKIVLRCALASVGRIEVAENASEANVFRLASGILGSEFKQNAACLCATANSYFDVHPEEAVGALETLSTIWLNGLPRLRDMLERQIRSNLEYKR